MAMRPSIIGMFRKFTPPNALRRPRRMRSRSWFVAEKAGNATLFTISVNMDAGNCWVLSARE